jgi:hypothetical protein
MDRANHDLRFFRFFPDTPEPRRAETSAFGSLPTRAYRYCEAVRLASSWGYWLFAPLAFEVVWDGSEILWRAHGTEEWEGLRDSVHFPGFPEGWDAACPEAFRGLSPPFLTALQEPGLLQVSLGVIATMTPGWLLYLRAAANFAGPAHVQGFEGLIDLEAYRFGPLFANVRLCQTGRPLTFLADRPWIQVSAVPRGLLGDLRTDAGTTDLAEWGAAEWAGYHDTIVEPNQRPGRARGEYAAEARKLSRCPVQR